MKPRPGLERFSRCEISRRFKDSERTGPRKPSYLTPADGFRHFFAYTVFVFGLPETRIFDYVVRCKGCSENIPAPVETMPSSWIIAWCPLCGERRYYLPTDIFRGRLSYRLNRKPVRSERTMR